MNGCAGRKGFIGLVQALTTLGEKRLFEQRFAHPSGRAELIAVDNHFPDEQVSAEFPLYLTTGRVLSHYLTGVQTRRSATLAARSFESFMEIHPKTAKKYRIEDSSLIKLESKRGSIVVRSKLTTDIREDTGLRSDALGRYSECEQDHQSGAGPDLPHAGLQGMCCPSEINRRMKIVINKIRMRQPWMK